MYRQSSETETTRQKMNASLYGLRSRKLNRDKQTHNQDTRRKKHRVKTDKHS